MPCFKPEARNKEEKDGDDDGIPVAAMVGSIGFKFIIEICEIHINTFTKATNITATDITNLGNLSGTNTGDQDLSTLALKTNVLELDNSAAFTPDADYEPTTKKYAKLNSSRAVC